ncbi:MAG: exosortase/archaeosortase family protein [Coriobacteriia bacterium]|jgi:exosortase/archaeosortase family protein|nr:exosortase/archaeosortase family protein [Coriobacteriia bacterium]
MSEPSPSVRRPLDRDSLVVIASIFTVVFLLLLGVSLALEFNGYLDWLMDGNAVIVAYPLSVKTRGLALVVGIPVIAVANMVRLVGGALASQYLSSSMFDFLHDYLFKVAMILVVVVLWAVWLQMARVHASKS